MVFLITLGNASSSEVRSIKYAIKIAHFLNQSEIATDAIKRIYLNNIRKNIALRLMGGILFILFYLNAIQNNEGLNVIFGKIKASDSSDGEIAG